MAQKSSPVAFVLSGGAGLEAIQVGMLRALYERGVAPDLIVATSAGAITLDVALIQGGEHADIERVVAATAGESERDGRATAGPW